MTPHLPLESSRSLRVLRSMRPATSFCCSTPCGRGARHNQHPSRRQNGGLPRLLTPAEPVGLSSREPNPARPVPLPVGPLNAAPNPWECHRIRSIGCVHEWDRGDFLSVESSEVHLCRCPTSSPSDMGREPIVWCGPCRLIADLDQKERNPAMPFAAALDGGGEHLVEVATSALATQVANEFFDVMSPCYDRASVTTDLVADKRSNRLSVLYNDLPGHRAAVLDCGKTNGRRRPLLPSLKRILTRPGLWPLSFQFSADPVWISTIGASIVEELLRITEMPS